MSNINVRISLSIESSLVDRGNGTFPERVSFEHDSYASGPWAEAVIEAIADAAANAITGLHAQVAVREKPAPVATIPDPGPWLVVPLDDPDEDGPLS